MAKSPTEAALVTGAIKRISLATVKVLCKQFKGSVYLTARHTDRGEEAIRQLKDEGPEAYFLQLDVTDKKSAEKARDSLLDRHGGLEVLINNTGISQAGAGGDQQSCGPEVCKRLFATNFHGVLNVCSVMFPILRPHARTLGRLRYVKADTLRKRLIADDLSTKELEEMAAAFLSVSETGNPGEAGYPQHFTAYSFFKVLVIAMSRFQQKMFDQNSSGKGIIVNAVCPGFVATDLTYHRGVKNVEQGADSPSYLALLPQEGKGSDIPRGYFVYERRMIDWSNEQDVS